MFLKTLNCWNTIAVRRRIAWTAALSGRAKSILMPSNSMVPDAPASRDD